MDAAGAARLQWRIEQQEQWRLARSVQDGRQPAVDPDSDDLVSFSGDLRIYSVRVTRDPKLSLCKRLVDGVWEHGTIEGPAGESDARDPAPDVARVA